MFSSPPLPPPRFHPKHISQPRLSASLTSYPSPTPPTSSCPHVAITLPPLPSALISPLPVLSLSSLPNSSSSLSPNASSSLQCLCVCVCLESGQHTPLLAAHLLSPVTALVGQVKGGKNESLHVDEDASPSLVVCLITAEHMVAHRCLSGRRPGAPALAQTRKHTITSLKTTKPSARNKSRTFQWEAEFAASQNRSLTILNMA